MLIEPSDKCRSYRSYRSYRRAVKEAAKLEYLVASKWVVVPVGAEDSDIAGRVA